MKYVVIDTETSGLFDFRLPADAEGQPRLASLAIVEVDARLNIEGQSLYYIKPDGWKLSEEARAINGLDEAVLEREGVPVVDALNVYCRLLDEGRAVVAFNAQFDTKVMRGELRRAGIPDRFEATPNICTMRAMIGVCRIPAKTGRGYKFPKLEEALNHFKLRPHGVTDSHSALADALSCLDLMRALNRINLLPAPEVHYAKNRPDDGRKSLV